MTSFFYTCEALSGFYYVNLSIDGGGGKEREKKEAHVFCFFT